MSAGIKRREFISLLGGARAATGDAGGGVFQFRNS